MEPLYITLRKDEPPQASMVFSDAREAYDHVVTRSQSEGRPISDYIIEAKPIE